MSIEKDIRGDRFRSAFLGIEYAAIRDQRVRYKLIISVVFLLTTLLFDDWFHFLFLLGVTGLMIIAEMFGTAIAALGDYVQPQHDTLINGIKDIAVGASWVAVFIWLVNIVVVMYELAALIRKR